MLQPLKKYYQEPLYKNSLSIILDTFFTAVFGLAFWVIAARTMEPDVLGLATAAISAGALIIYISRLGTDIGLLRYLPTSVNRVGLFSTSLLVTLPSSVILGIVYLTLTGILSPRLSFLAGGIYPLLFLGYVALTSIYLSQNTALTSLRRADMSLIQDLLMGIRVPIIFFIASLGAAGVFSSYIAAIFISLVFGAFVLYRLQLYFKPIFDKEAFKGTITYSLGNYTSGLLSVAPITILPLLVVNLLGSKESAYFYIAYSIANILFMIPTAVSTSLFVEGSHKMPLKENAYKSLKFILLLLIPAIVFIFLFGDRLLIIFNKDYAIQSLELLQLLALCSIFSIAGAIYLAIMRVRKDVRMVNVIMLAQWGLIIGSGYVFMQSYGLIGLGYAWLISNILISIIVVGLVLTRKNEASEVE